MSTENNREERLKNFEYLMKIIDDAEGERDTKKGPFSFLWENSYVRQVVITPGHKTGIPGLKTFLATEVLGIFKAKNKSKVSYLDMQAQLSGDKSVNYQFHYDFLEEMFDIEKNRNAMRKHCWLIPENEVVIEQIENMDICLPYLFMERLREVVWKKLKTFFRLCEQEICSECEEKSKAYFQFIQAVALYEIFLLECVQEKGTAYVEESMRLMKEIEDEMESIKNQTALIVENVISPEEEMMTVMQTILTSVNRITDVQHEEFSKHVGYVGAFQLMMADFGISYNAMCYLLMVVEAMNACAESMRGLTKVSLKLMDELADVYEKDLIILQKYNKNRSKSYKEVNKKFEEVMEKYGDPVDDVAVIMVAFMEELYKASGKRDLEAFHRLECKLGYPVYRDLGGE